jgi:hypothetical protein
MIGIHIDVSVLIRVFMYAGKREEFENMYKTVVLREHQWFLYNIFFLFLGTFAKLRKASISFVMSLYLSVCSPTWNNSAPAGLIS